MFLLRTPSSSPLPPLFSRSLQGSTLLLCTSTGEAGTAYLQLERVTVAQGHSLCRILRRGHVEGSEDPPPTASGQRVGVPYRQERGELDVTYLDRTLPRVMLLKVDVCVRKLTALLNPVSKKKPVTAPRSAPAAVAFGGGEGADEWDGEEGGVGGGGCVPEDEDSSEGDMGADDDYELNDEWGDGGEEEEATVVLGGAGGAQIQQDEEVKPEEASTT